jgi:hypothetical protein
MQTSVARGARAEIRLTPKHGLSGPGVGPVDQKRVNVQANPFQAALQEEIERLRTGINIM